MEHRFLPRSLPARLAAAGLAALLAPLAAQGETWAHLAWENQTFSVSGTQTVRYGANASWITRSVTNGAPCTNAFFGSDPAVGIGKTCQLGSGGTAPAPAPSPTTAWTHVAWENQSFSVNGTQTVRYGANASWVTKSVSGGAPCSNAFFGTDPAVGVGKTCQVASGGTAPAPAPAPTGEWTEIARENQSFSVSGTQLVRYGANASWLTKSVAGSGQCSNTFFGGDPAYGIGKVCQVSAAAAPAPAPAPVATAQVCTPPVTPASTTGIAASVGNGTPQSCTEAALRAAVGSQSVVTFNCGSSPVTIAISRTIDLPTERSIVIDGGHQVTLDGGGTTRIFSAVRGNYRTNHNTVTLQRLTLANGRAQGTQYVAPNPSNPSCAYGWADGAGGGILVRDTKLRVIDSVFRNNAAATPGPDVGGGAIYAMGSLEVTVVGSTFTGNSGSNSGAVGLLQTDGRFYNSAFQNNVANGTGQNFAGGAATGCPGVGHPDQGGAGGNAGAIGVDGAHEGELMVCGVTFTGNKANELAGALARSANVTPRRTTIDRSLFRGNSARQAGALFLVNANPLEITASTFADNSARLAGAAQLYATRPGIVNSTFSGNVATAGLGGALLLEASDSAGAIRNVTFTGNRSTGGPGFFSAAIAGSLNVPVYNTVFANNTTLDAGSPMQCTFVAGTGANDVQWPRNRVTGGVLDTPCVGGILFADPQLAPLAANGGPTPTAAPAAGSPLRGAGRNCPATDQRGNPRNTSQCTVGAVE